MLKFGIYTNKLKDPGFAATRTLVDALTRRNCPISYDDDTAAAMQIRDYTDARHADILFILGGDGTILRAARKYVPFGTSLIGINVGRLGFMSEIYLDEVDLLMDKVLQSDYYMDTRMMLEAHTENMERPVLALNDFVIRNKNKSKMARIAFYVNNIFAESYNVDGLVVATPTGSTAYSLAAGGPIVIPNFNCKIITPVCPHTLYSRSMVIKPSDEVGVEGREEELLSVLADGQQSITLDPGKRVRITNSQSTAKFLRIKPDNFFTQLNEKLSQRNTC